MLVHHSVCLDFIIIYFISSVEGFGCHVRAIRLTAKGRRQGDSDVQANKTSKAETQAEKFAKCVHNGVLYFRRVLNLIRIPGVFES